MSATQHDTSKQPKVIGLGLGRTGTMSLQAALEILGFGPVYHMSTILFKGDPEELEKWKKLADPEGKGTADDFHKLLEGFGGCVDYPVAMFAEGLYKAYPDAKFILTVRDPVKWEKSMKDTVLNKELWKEAEAASVPMLQAVGKFRDEVVGGWYHRGRLMDHAQEEFHRHTEHVKSIIPAEKLLIYEVSEGWDRLVEFLQVPKPKEDFPHLNDSAGFQQLIHAYIAVGGDMSLLKRE